jgi:putative transposase
MGNPLFDSAALASSWSTSQCSARTPSSIRTTSAATEEGHLMPDHVHMMISIPPKYAVSQVIGFIKGKSAIHVARTYGERKRNFVGQNFWARGYFVSTVGRDEALIRQYIKNQEQEDKRLDQLNLWR